MALRILHLALFFLALNLNGQSFHQPKNRQQLSLNLGGHASAISVQYEYLQLGKESIDYNARIGLGYNEEFNLFPTEKNESFLCVPARVGIILGKKRHRLELSLGSSLVLGNTNQHFIAYPSLGYRFLPREVNKLTFGLYFQVPSEAREMQDILFIPFGLELGYLLF